jgi:hypothetical protein
MQQADSWLGRHRLEFGVALTAARVSELAPG